MKQEKYPEISPLTNASQKYLVIVCQNCCSIVPSRKELLQHLKKGICSHQPSITDYDSSSIQRYKCDEIGCDKIYYDLTSYNQHKRRHKKLFECIYCHSSFGALYHLRRHLKRVHQTELKNDIYTKQDDADIPRYKCQFCHKSFKSRSDLKKHVNFHHINIEKQYFCKKCYKSFRTKGNLKEHLLVHLKTEERKLYHCPEKFCDAKLLSQPSLNRHLKKMHHQK